jgi:hypothetical protein
MVVIEKRRACFDCKILGRIHFPKKNAGGRPAVEGLTNSQFYIRKIYGGCRQCNAPLCIDGICWKAYHNVKKYI